MRPTLILLFSLGVTSCGDIVEKDKIASHSQSNGDSSTTISNSNQSFSISATTDSNLSGAELFVQPGSLAVGTTINISSSQDIVSSDTGSVLSTTSVVEAGPAVFFESTGASLSINPMSITIPLASTSLNYQNIVVIYKSYDSNTTSLNADTVFYLGVIPTSELTISESSVTFSTKRFGAYQAAISSEPITEAREVQTPEPISKTQVNETDYFYGLWRSNCESSGNNDDSGYITLLLNEDNTYTETGYYHSGPNCDSSQLYIVEIIRGKLELGIPNANNIREINVKPASIYWAYKNSGYVQQANQISQCGSNNWEIHQFKEITAQSCFNSEDLEPIYTIVQTSRDQLFGGLEDSQERTTPSTRPTEIDTSRPLNRVTN